MRGYSPQKIIGKVDGQLVIDLENAYKRYHLAQYNLGKAVYENAVHLDICKASQEVNEAWLYWRDCNKIIAKELNEQWPFVEKLTYEEA